MEKHICHIDDVIFNWLSPKFKAKLKDYDFYLNELINTYIKYHNKYDDYEMYHELRLRNKLPFFLIEEFIFEYKKWYSQEINKIKKIEISFNANYQYKPSFKKLFSTADYKVIKKYKTNMWIMPLNTTIMFVFGRYLHNCWGSGQTANSYLSKGSLVLVDGKTLTPIIQNTISEIKFRAEGQGIDKEISFRGMNNYNNKEKYKREINDIIKIALNAPVPDYFITDKD